MPQTKSEIWTGACAEAETEWLTGPLAHDTLLVLVGPCCVVSCRFGLALSDKIRAIDDLSGSLVNSAYGSSYQLNLKALTASASC